MTRVNRNPQFKTDNAKQPPRPMSMLSENYEKRASSETYQIRKESISAGGCGEFLRAAKILDIMIEEEKLKLKNLMPDLESLMERLAPQETALLELRQKFEETENAIFGSQIRPLEIRLKPLQEMREQQEFAVESQKEYISELLELRDEAVSSFDSFKSEGQSEVFYAGFNRTWTVDANRSFALGPDGESEFVLAATKGGFEITAKWLSDKAEQPLLVESYLRTGGLLHGIVVSFATPEEGPKRLCAVSEWFGDVKSVDVSQRIEQLLLWLKMDNLKVADLSKILVSTWSNPIPLKRRNELWVEIVPPVDQEWLDHAAKIATNVEAKNSSLYQLKDCPWATPVPWGMAAAAGQEQRGRDAPLDGRACTWNVGTSLLGGGNLLSVAVSGGGGGVGVDRSGGGEVAVWCLDAHAAAAAGGDEDDAVALYAVGQVGGGWPVQGRDVEAGRLRLVQSVTAGGQHAPLDPLSFRLRAAAPGAPAEILARVRPANVQ
jgi:hypothetical protein